MAVSQFRPKFRRHLFQTHSTKIKRYMLIAAKLAPDFSRVCAHPDTRPLISTTRPHTIRESISANASCSKGERGSVCVIHPVRSIMNEVLSHKLVDVVVVAIVYAV